MKKINQARIDQIATVGDLRKLLDGHSDDQPLVVCPKRWVDDPREDGAVHVYRFANSLGDVMEASDSGSDGTLVLFVDDENGSAYSDDGMVDIGLN